MIDGTSVLCYRVLYFNWLAVRHRAQRIVSIRACRTSCLKQLPPPLGMASQWVTSDLHLIKHLQSVLQVTSFVFAWMWPPQLFTGCKQFFSGSLKCLLMASPGSQRLSVCGSAQLIGWGGWFPSPAWQLSGCVPQFSSFLPSQSAHSLGWSSPAVRRTSRLCEYDARLLFIHGLIMD